MEDRTTHKSGTIADVLVSDHLDSLIVLPRERSDLMVVSRLVREAIPEAHVRVSAGGLFVPGQFAGDIIASEVGSKLNWDGESQVYAANRLRTKDVNIDLRKEVNKVVSGGSNLAKVLLADCKGLEVLDDHQWINVAAMVVPGSYGLCLFDEQGAGKTVSLIFAFDVLAARDEVDFLLVVSPKSMVPEWENDFRRFMGDYYKVQVVSGARADKFITLGSGADVLITNYETTVSMENEILSVIRRFGERAVLVVDESYFIKNLNAKRTSALRRLREWCGRAYVLSGTPAPNAPHDLVQQFNIVDFGITFGGVNIPEDRTSAMPVIQEAINVRGVFIRHLKGDVFPGLPAKKFQRVLVAMNPKQEKVYRAALDGLIKDLRQTDESSFARNRVSFIEKRVRLLQVCSNPGSIFEDYTETPTKLDVLDNLLEEAITSRGEKVIIWSFFTYSLEAILERYQKFKPVRYDGKVADINERRDAVKKFQEDNETMLFVANPAAAGAGLTLHRARIAIFESMSNQAAHYLQSIDRIHRRGQERDVEYIVLLCDKSIELLEYDRLVWKERSAQELLGDRTQKLFTRETMLAEAIEAKGLLDR